MIDRERLRARMSELGVTQAELARRAHVSPAAIQQILNGSSVRSKALPWVAEALNVDIRWLQGSTDDKGPVFYRIAPDVDTVVLPVIRYEKVSGSDSITENVTQYMRFSLSWIKLISGGDQLQGLYIFEMPTHDMAPTISRGDQLCLRGAGGFDGDTGSIWFLQIDGWNYVRRVKKDDGGFLLSSDNPSSTGIMVEAERIRFFAKVIWQGRSLVA